MNQRYTTSISCAALTAVLLLPSAVNAQNSRLPIRATPPEFDVGKFEGVFFADVNQVLIGELPKQQSTSPIATSMNSTGIADTVVPDGIAGAAIGNSSDKMGWKNLISSTSLEELVKDSKLRLDKVITTPAAFAGGGYNEARIEFSLLSLLFAIIENYPGEVRWKNSAAAARTAMERTAANSKVGSRQVFDEAKKRIMDLEGLLGGSAMRAEVTTEIVWENLIDIAPVMNHLDWAHNEQLSKMVSNQAEFNKNHDAISRYADLVAILGKTITFKNMPNADDKGFVAIATEMVGQAQQLSLAVKSENAELARTASGKLGQCCTNCHDSYN